MEGCIPTISLCITPSGGRAAITLVPLRPWLSAYPRVLPLSPSFSKLNLVTSKDPKKRKKMCRRKAQQKGSYLIHLLLYPPRAHSETLREASGIPKKCSEKSKAS